MNKTIENRLRRLEEAIGLKESRVSISSSLKSSSYDLKVFKKILVAIAKNCEKQLRQNPQSTITVDIYKDEPCVIIKGSHYPESFNDGIENALENNDLYTSDQRDTRVGYVIKISGY